MACELCGGGERWDGGDWGAWGGGPAPTLWKGNKSWWIPASHDTLNAVGGAKVGRQSPTLEWKHTPVSSLIFIPPQRRVRQQGAGGERKEARADPENVPEIIPRSWILNLISGLTCHWPDVVSSALRF